MADFTYALPSGLEVGFRPPTYNDRREALQNYDQKEGFLPEEFLAAKCLQVIGGQVINEAWETSYISRFDGWALKDQALYVQLFLQMFQPDDNEKNRVVEDAKKLLAGSATSSATKEA